MLPYHVRRGRKGCSSKGSAGKVLAELWAAEGALQARRLADDQQAAEHAHKAKWFDNVCMNRQY
jgi:hypothetical protein